MSENDGVQIFRPLDRSQGKYITYCCLLCLQSDIRTHQSWIVDSVEMYVGLQTVLGCNGLLVQYSIPIVRTENSIVWLPVLLIVLFCFADYYPNCEILFMSLANIHTIRKSFLALRTICATSPDQPGFAAFVLPFKPGFHFPLPELTA